MPLTPAQRKAAILHYYYYSRGGDPAFVINDYLNRVADVGGSISDINKGHITVLVNTLNNAGVWSKIKDMGLFMGGSLVASAVKLKYADPNHKSLTYTNFVSGDYGDATGLTATTTGKIAATGIIPNSVGLSKDNFCLCYISLHDVQTTNAFLMLDNVAVGPAQLYLAKTSSGMNAAITPPTNRTITIPQTRIGEDRFQFSSSNGKILWGRDFVYHYPIGNVDTPNLELDTEITLFKGRNGGSDVFGTGRIPFYAICEYMSWEEIVILQKSIRAFLISIGRLTDEAELITFGDSITRGAGASVFSNRYSYLLAAALGLKERNMGLDGSRFNANQAIIAGGFARRDNVLNYNVLNPSSKIIIQYGVNDMITDGSANGNPTTISLLSANMTSFINELKLFGVGVDQIQLGSCSYVSTSLCSTTKQSAYRDALKSVAQSTGVLFADCYQYMLDNGDESLLSDTVHPNDSGHAAISLVHETLAHFVI